MSDNLPAPHDAMLVFLDRIVRDPTVDVGKMREVLELQRDVRREHAKMAFNAAMASVQEGIGSILRTGKNPTFNNPYAKLEDLDRAARPIYSRHGFSVRYGSAPPPREGWIRITLTIAHRDGYSEEHYLDGPTDMHSSGQRARTGIQAVGSTVTYLRRYLLQMVLNLVPADDPSDDDGEALRRSAPPPRPSSWQPQPQHTQPRPNGGDVWMKETIRLVKDKPDIDAKCVALQQRLVQWWDNTEALERFAGNLEWQAFVADQFPPDSEILNAVIVDRIAEISGGTAA